MTCSSIESSTQLNVKTERIKALRVVGEQIGQLVLENSTCLNAVKIDRVSAQLLNSIDHLFPNKVVKQGTIRVEIFYVNPDGILRFLADDVPFMLPVDIPGFVPNPFSEVQNHLLDIDVNYRLSPAKHCLPGCLKQTIVAHILVKASEWTQIDVVTHVGLFPNVTFIAQRCRCRCF